MTLNETMLLKNISYPDFDDMSWKKASVLIKNGLIEGVYELGQEPDRTNSSLTAAAIKDLEGKILIPAFLDSHLHPHNWATREMMDPLYSISLSMKDPRGPAFSFDFLQALEAYSKGNAKIWGLEDSLGQIKPSYQAKLLILDETDPEVLEDPDRLMNVKILERMD
jgi:predicted amidohydrolase YtcJ